MNGDGVDGARIQDVSTVGYDYGVFVVGGDDIALKRVTSSGSGLAGVASAADADGMHMDQVAVTGNGSGLEVCSGCDGARISKTNAVGNGGHSGFGGYGIALSDDDAVIRSSVANGNQIGISAASTMSDGGTTSLTRTSSPTVRTSSAAERRGVDGRAGRWI